MFTMTGGDLASTLTYPRREWTWFSNGTGMIATRHNGDVPADGLLTIRLWKGRRAGSRSEADTYAVQEVEPAAFGCRTFWLLNLSDPSQPQPWVVTVGVLDLCTCDAGVCKLPACKHRDALKVLIAEGLLPPLAEVRPAARVRVRPAADLPACFAGAGPAAGPDCPF